MTPTRTAFLVLCLVLSLFSSAILYMAYKSEHRKRLILEEYNEYLNNLADKLLTIDKKQDKAMCNCYNYPNHDSLTKAIVKRLNKQKRSF